MKVFAHRGFSGRYPENTMTAFKKAYEAGADGIELDVQLTKDGQVVIIHDELVDRTTDAKGFVRDYTLEELQKFDASILHKDTCEREKIPTFDEYCKWVKDTNMITNVELKTGVYYYQNIEEKTLEIVKKYNLEDRIIFSSFNHLSALKIKKLAPNIQCGLLTENGGIANAGQYCKDFGFEFYHPDWHDLTEEEVRGCKDANIGLNVWTVNDLDNVEKLYNYGCNAIITNFPQIPVIWLKNK